MCCSHEYHAELRRDPDRLRAETSFAGIQDAGFDLLELRSCRACTSTLSVRGIGPERNWEGI